MSISVTCIACDSKMRFADDKRGKRVKCSSCGEAIQIPVEDEDEESSDDDVERLVKRKRPTKSRKGKSSRSRNHPPPMLVIIGGCIAIVAIVVIGGLALSRPPTTQAPAPMSGVQTSAGSDGTKGKATTAPAWETFQHPGLGFSVDVPDKHRDSVQVTSDERSTIKQEMRDFRIPGAGLSYFMVTCRTFSDRQLTPSAGLKWGAEGVPRVDTLLQTSAIEHQGIDGFEILTVAYSGWHRRSRVFYYQGSVVIFEIIWGDKTEPIALRDRFFAHATCT